MELEWPRIWEGGDDEDEDQSQSSLKGRRLPPEPDTSKYTEENGRQIAQSVQHAMGSKDQASGQETTDLRKEMDAIYRSKKNTDRAKMNKIYAMFSNLVNKTAQQHWGMPWRRRNTLH